MATTSRIGILHNNIVRSIHCHWDGNLGEVGKILLNHYQDESKINELIDLGDISSLGSIVHPEGKHTYEDPLPDVVVAYGRDRQELDTGCQTGSLIEFEELSENYNYLFKDGKWYTFFSDIDQMEELTKELIAAEG